MCLSYDNVMTYKQQATVLRLNKTWSNVSTGNRRMGRKDHHLQHPCLWYLVYGSANSYCQFFHFLIPCTVADLPPRSVLTLVDPSCVAAGPRFCSCCAGALRFGHGTSVSEWYQTSMLQWPLVPFAVQPPAWVRGGQHLWLLPLPLPLPTTLAPGGILPLHWVSKGALTLSIPYHAQAHLTLPRPACLTNVSTVHFL